MRRTALRLLQEQSLQLAPRLRVQSLSGGCARAATHALGSAAIPRTATVAGASPPCRLASCMLSRNAVYLLASSVCLSAGPCACSPGSSICLHRQLLAPAAGCFCGAGHGSGAAGAPGRAGGCLSNTPWGAAWAPPSHYCGTSAALPSGKMALGWLGRLDVQVGGMPGRLKGSRGACWALAW